MSSFAYFLGKLLGFNFDVQSMNLGFFYELKENIQKFGVFLVLDLEQLV